MMQRVALWCLAGLAWSAPALADLRIGFVDARSLQMTVGNSPAGKQHRADMEKFIKEKEAALGKEDQKLRAQQQDMEKEMLTLSEPQRQQKQKELEEKRAVIQKMAEEAQQEARKRDLEFQQRLETEANKVISEAAREAKVSLVLNRAEVMYSDGTVGVDLTATVTQRLQAALQQVDGKGGKKK